jgi:hypothetical protein
MLSANISKHGSDVAIRAVHDQAALGEIPGEAGKPALDRRDREGRGPVLNREEVSIANTIVIGRH